VGLVTRKVYLKTPLDVTLMDTKMRQNHRDDPPVSDVLHISNGIYNPSNGILHTANVVYNTANGVLHTANGFCNAVSGDCNASNGFFNTVKWDCNASNGDCNAVKGDCNAVKVGFCEAGEVWKGNGEMGEKLE